MIIELLSYLSMQDPLWRVYASDIIRNVCNNKSVIKILPFLVMPSIELGGLQSSQVKYK